MDTLCLTFPGDKAADEAENGLRALGFTVRRVPADDGESCTVYATPTNPGDADFDAARRLAADLGGDDDGAAGWLD